MKNAFKFEPAVWKGIVSGLVALLAIWGLDVASLGTQLEATIDVVAILIPFIASAVAGIWIRKSVTPDAKVVERVTDEGVVVAGPANYFIDEGDPIRLQDHLAPDEDEVPAEDEPQYEPRHLA